MKIISLNIWGGRAGREGLLDFFKKYEDIDVFCLQEVWSAAYDHLEGFPAGGVVISHANVMTRGLQEITGTLSAHGAYFRPHLLDNYGLLTLAKKSISIAEEGEVFVYKEKGHVPEKDAGFHARNVQYVTAHTPDGLRTIMNFHGLWNGNGKGDCEDRLLQSEKIVEFIRRFDHPYVLCGDFNLEPGTRSIALLEETGLRNLVKEYGITSTRTSFYKKEGKFADYAFVSPEVNVVDFKVLPDEVSDHAPLYLEIR